MYARHKKTGKLYFIREADSYLINGKRKKFFKVEEDNNPEILYFYEDELKVLKNYGRSNNK